MMLLTLILLSLSCFPSEHKKIYDQFCAPVFVLAAWLRSYQCIISVFSPKVSSNSENRLPHSALPGLHTHSLLFSPSLVLTHIYTLLFQTLFHIGTLFHRNLSMHPLLNFLNQSCMSMSFSHTVSDLVLVLHSCYMSIHCYCFSHCFCSHILFITTCPHCTTIYGFTFILALC